MDTIDACEKALEIVGNHLANRRLDRLDKRTPLNKLYVDLYICHHFRQEKQARMLLPRLRSEIQTLFTCSTASQPDTIEGILLRRFFGTSSSYVHRSYERPISKRSAIQPVANAASNKVFSIPELLEAMLSHLPSRSLIRSTGVSKTFRDLTQSSPTLLKNLFLLAKEEPLEAPSLAHQGQGGSGDHSDQTKPCKIATLCPLLHTDRRSHLTVEQRFIFKDIETAAIDPCAEYAGSFTNMYLTNPPCAQVYVRVVYKGTAYRTRAPVGEAVPAIHTTIYALHKISNETGVTFAMLMEVLHMVGCVFITTTDRFGKTGDEGTFEGYAYRPGECLVQEMTLHEQIRD